MNVCFLNPPVTPYRKIMRNFDCATESKGNYLYQPYDFLLLSGKLHSEDELLFIDAIAHPEPIDSITQRIKIFSPHVIIVALAQTNWEEDFRFLKQIRDEFPKTYLLCFGDVFIEDWPNDVVKPWADGVLNSPADFDFHNIENSLSQKTGLRTHVFHPSYGLKAPRTYPEIMPRHLDFINKKYRWPFAREYIYSTVFLNWGCPYSCNYCIMSKFPNLQRKLDSVKAELKVLSQMGIKEIYFGDRSFGIPEETVLELMDYMIRQNFGFSWSTYFHPNQYSPKLLRAMKRAGCHTIIIGIETADGEELKNYKRFIKKNAISDLITEAQILELDICADFIIGLPHDTHDSIDKLIKLSTELPLDYASFNIAAPLPGSDLRKIAKNKNNDFSGHDSLGKNKLESFCQVSAHELMISKQKAVRSFYLRPQYLIRRLCKIKTFPQLIIQLQEAIGIILKQN